MNRWIVGWKKYKADDWEFIVDYVSEYAHGEMRIGEPYVDASGETVYYPVQILSRESNELLSALEDLSYAMDEAGGSENLHRTLQEIVQAAYEAGRQHDIVPTDT